MHAPGDDLQSIGLVQAESAQHTRKYLSAGILCNAVTDQMFQLDVSIRRPIIAGIWLSTEDLRVHHMLPAVLRCSLQYLCSAMLQTKVEVSSFFVVALPPL